MHPGLRRPGPQNRLHRRPLPRRGGGPDWANNVIGHLATFRDNTPTGTTVATDQMITDYEAIVLADNVAVSNILPGGRPLEGGERRLRPANRSAISG